MSEWSKKRINQLGRVVTGKTPPKDEPHYFDGEELFISPKDLDWDQLYVNETGTRVSVKALEKFRNQVIPKNSVLFTSLSFGFGKMGISSRPSLTNQQINSVVVNSDNDFHFVYYLLQACTQFIFAYNSGIDTPIVPKSVFERIELRCPQYSEQRKIAAVLWAYDELIENNKRRIALLERLAEEIYREWFVRFRFPGHETTKVIKGIPCGWEVRALGSFANEIKRGVRKKDLPDDEKYIGLEHIPRRSISIKNWATADTIESNKLTFQNRDILFGKIRPYLHKVCLAHFSGACSSDTIIIRPKEKFYEGYLLFTVFSDTFIDLATIASKGTKMPRADWGFLKKLELAVPSKDLLENYQTQFDAVFCQIVNLLQTNDRLTSSRDLLLPRLISAKLSVEQLDIKFPPGMGQELNADSPISTNA